MTVIVRHALVELALHELRAGDGRPLLLLHGLGEKSPASVPNVVAGWPGPVHALDFTGHGESSLPKGGGYFAELLMGDADAALAHLGAATIVGRGLGAYVALLLAGGRPKDVRGAVLTDGPGLAGGGPLPGSAYVITSPLEAGERPDPFALAELTRDVRPPDYATSFARQAIQLSGLREPIAVAAIARPEWLTAVATEPGVTICSVEAALESFAS